jgi:hypothetical protein
LLGCNFWTEELLGGQQKALNRSVIEGHKASPGLASSTPSQGGNQIKSPLSFASVWCKPTKLHIQK